MKLHEYLWEYIDFQNKNPGLSDLEAQGHVHQYLNGEEIIADSNGEKLNEREARSILGRNEKRLREAYEMGNKPLFAAVCMYQQMSDDEWHKAKEEAEKAEEVDPGFSMDPGTGAEDEDQAEAAGETE